MRIQLSDHFSYGKLLRFTLSTILMLICTSMYSIVDGFFVSNYVGKTAFAAVNLIYPVSMGVTAIGFMLGTGGSAIVSKTLGQGDRQLANRYFSLIIYVAIGAGAVLSGLCFAFTPQIAALLGVQGALMQQCVVYGRILFLAQGAFMLQTMFQTFFVAAEKPGLSLKINLLAGATNMVFDYLFVTRAALGACGRGRRHRHEPGGGRRGAAYLLCAQKRQPAAPYPAHKILWPRAFENVHQRLV